MPAYNASRFIGEAIESLLNQSFRDFELWIIDDGSSDDTLKLVQNYATHDKRINVFYNKTNQGKLLTVNARVHEITTPFFTITDADDVSHPQRLEKQLTLFQENRNLMMCGTSYWAMDEHGFLVRKMQLLTQQHQIRERALHQSPFMGGTTLMRKEVLIDFPEFYRAYFKDNQFDSDLTCRLLDKYETTNLPESLYFYRIVHSSLSRKQVTVRNLTLYNLIAHLSKQRRVSGKDCIENGHTEEATAFMTSIEQSYQADPSYFFRHQAFFHLYWGLNNSALSSIWKAFLAKPLVLKNILGVPYTLLRIIFFMLNRRLNSIHYTQQIKRT